MTYVPWVAVYEGPTDRAYFEVLLPRLMEEIVLQDGIRSVTIPPEPSVDTRMAGRSIDQVTEFVCANSDSYHLVFVHADAGGRNQAKNLAARSLAYCEACRIRCDWPRERCVVLAPRHETEAWALADPGAVASALGYAGNLSDLHLPADAAVAETLADPKGILQSAYHAVRGRRVVAPPAQLLTAIAQEQSFDCLRLSPSFRAAEEGVRRGLASLGCIAPL